MCLDVECEYDLIGDPTWRTARKPHRCDECSRTVDVGERYWHYAYKEWGASTVDDARLCAHCRMTIELGAALTGCPMSWWFGSVHSLEGDEGGFVGDILVNHDLATRDRYRMLRTVVGRHKQWRRRDGSLLPVPVAAP